MQNAEVRAVQSPATLCNRRVRHAAEFVLSMLKINAAAWRLHRVLDSALWERYGVFWSAVGASRARYKGAV